jgi:hypothetical protein
MYIWVWTGMDSDPLADEDGQVSLACSADAAIARVSADP